MKELTQVENHQVEIWRRARQRSLKLTVKPCGKLLVTCAKRVPLAAIRDFVLESGDFILKRQLANAAARARFPTKRFESGETFLFFGQPAELQIVWTWERKVRVEWSEGILEMLSPLTATVLERQRALHAFFKNRAQTHLKDKVAILSEKMALPPKKLVLRGQRTRWGSCTSAGTISLNWKLLAAPREVIDYVVIHELAHLRHMNHSPRFWGLVAAHDPDYKLHRRWLKEHEKEIAVQFSLDQAAPEIRDESA